jgi:hypothetical protein
MVEMVDATVVASNFCSRNSCTVGVDGLPGQMI